MIIIILLYRAKLHSIIIWTLLMLARLGPEKTETNMTVADIIICSQQLRDGYKFETSFLFSDKKKPVFFVWTHSCIFISVLPDSIMPWSHFRDDNEEFRSYYNYPRKSFRLRLTFRAPSCYFDRFRDNKLSSKNIQSHVRTDETTFPEAPIKYKYDWRSRACVKV